MLLLILMDKKFLEGLAKKYCKEEFIVEKVIQRKCDKLYVNWKGMIILLIVGLIKKDIVEMSEFFRTKIFGKKNES